MREPVTDANDGVLARRPAGPLTPIEIAARRKNRRWMGLVVAPSLLIGAAALIAAVVAGAKSPSVQPAQVPAGYRAVSDGYFAYAVPSSWTQSGAYSDDVGDLDTQGTSGWVGEHVSARATPPTAGEAAPASFATFGETRPTPYRMGPPVPVTVAGATVAYRYVMTRPGGFAATAVDAWRSATGAELWLVVDADPATTSAILASLKG